MPKAELEQRRADGPRTFQLGYQNRALIEGDLTYPSFGRCCTVSNSVKPAALVQRGWRIYSGVDLSSKKRPGNVIFTIAVHPVTGVRVPIDIRRGAWTSDQTGKNLVDVYQTHHPEIILVENNGYQQSLIDWMRVMPNAPKLPIASHTTGANKSHPEIGLPGLEIEFNGGMWEIYLPDHGLICRRGEGGATPCGWCQWAEEMRGHPASASTDCVMACWFAREAIRRTGGSFHDVKPIQDVLPRTMIDKSTLRAFSAFS